MAAAAAGILETDLQDALDLRAGIIVGVVRLVVVLIFLTEIHTAGELADADEIGTLHEVLAQRRLVDEAVEGLDRADVGEQAKFLAHSQQPLLGTHLGGGVIVELGVTYGREEHCVSLHTGLESILGEGVPNCIDGCGAADCVLESHLMTEFGANRAHYVNTLF